MKTKITLIAVVTLLALTGCGDAGAEQGGTDTPTYHYTFYQELPGGEKVLCAWAKSGYGGGLSCDWAHKVVDIGEKK